MALISWVGLRERSPVDLSRLVSHANSFTALVGVKITNNNLNRAKKSLIDARAELDLVFTTLQQVLYDRDVLKGRIDEVLYGWMVDNMGRYQKSIDDKEEDLIIKYESSDVKMVGVARISAYAKALKIAQSMIYESLLKSIDEYEKIVETDEIKKNKRTFLYILFHVLQVTMASVGGLARQGTGLMAKKGQVGSYPTTWQSLISQTGQKQIAEKNKDETGEDIVVPEFMVDKESVEKIDGVDTDENTLFLEENEENEENEEDENGGD